VIILNNLDRLANAVWTMRRGRRLTQQQLATRIGKTEMTISVIELGKASCKIGTLIEIANALGYDLALVSQEDA
jgi:transcriptional regulator with XRE-family HTH domain